MINDKKNVMIHPFPKNSMQEIHKKYGLWIFGAHAGGCSLPGSYSFVRPRMWPFYSISHMFAGKGRLQLSDGREFDVNPGDAIFIPPNTVNIYGGIGKEAYHEDFVNFTGPLADMLCRSGLIPTGIVHFGEVRCLLPIIELANDPAIDSQIKANFELQKLLTEYYLDQRSGIAEYPLFDKLLAEIKKHLNKWWNVREMAEMCSISDDQLRRIFVKRTGCLPKLYVDKLKLHRAAELLVATDKSISEIAEALGYLDSCHFSRRFKSVIGTSPAFYRISQSNLKATRSVHE